MAHHKRKRARVHSPAGKLDRERIARLKARGERHLWFHATPMAWNIIYHVRPARRAARRLEGRILRGADPESLAWPVMHRPHIHYW